MSELLTTGQMIDRLKPGEVAESKNRKAYYDSNCQLIEESKATGEKRPFTIWSGDKSPIWRILPRYVNIEEATKALMDRKTVRVWANGEKTTISLRMDDKGALYAFFEHDCGDKKVRSAICLGDKYTIEE